MQTKKLSGEILWREISIKIEVESTKNLKKQKGRRANKKQDLKFLSGQAALLLSA